MNDITDFQGAGFLIQKTGAPHLFLALENDKGEYDIPKGIRDENETVLETAQRECFEESSIIINKRDLLISSPITTNEQLYIFIAQTTQEPFIRPNPKSGKYEHKRALWCEADVLQKKCISYLSPLLCKAFYVIGF